MRPGPLVRTQHLTHMQHPQPLDIPRRWLPESTRAGAFKRTSSGTRRAPQWLVNHPLTTYHINTSEHSPTWYPQEALRSRSYTDPITLPSAHLSPQFVLFDSQSAATTRAGPSNNSGSRSSANLIKPQPTSSPPHPTALANPTSARLASPLPLVYPRPASGFEPREISQPPPPPHPKGCGWRGLILR